MYECVGGRGKNGWLSVWIASDSVTHIGKVPQPQPLPESEHLRKCLRQIFARAYSCVLLADS